VLLVVLLLDSFCWQLRSCSGVFRLRFHYLSILYNCENWVQLGGGRGASNVDCCIDFLVSGAARGRGKWIKWPERLQKPFLCVFVFPPFSGLGSHPLAGQSLSSVET
jgi:hypothetical protein